MFIKKYYKFPRTYHYKWSENLQNDDRMLLSLDGFLGKEVIVSEKLDGEGASLYNDHIHARSPDSGDHLSRHWVKALHGTIKHQIPKGWRICGENMFALHSIYYTGLTSYFYVFAIFDENNVCLPWKDVEEFSELLGLQTVPILYKGAWDKDLVSKCYTRKSILKGWTPKQNIKDFKDFRRKIFDGEEISTFAEETQEGYVCRIADAFNYSDYDKYVGKFVKKNHVQSSDNWMTEVVIPNKLKGKIC